MHDDPSGGGGVQLMVADQPGAPELLEQGKDEVCLRNSIVKQPEVPIIVPGFCVSWNELI